MVGFSGSENVCFNKRLQRETALRSQPIQTLGGRVPRHARVFASKQRYQEKADELLGNTPGAGRRNVVKIKTFCVVGTSLHKLATQVTCSVMKLPQH